jgi:hypothetical protein
MFNGIEMASAGVACRLGLLKDELRQVHRAAVSGIAMAAVCG